MNELLNLIPLAGSLLPLEGTIPDPAPAMPPGFKNFVSILAWVKWGALIALGVILIVTAVMMTSDRNGGTEYMTKLGKIVVAAILVTSAVTIIGFMAGV